MSFLIAGIIGYLIGTVPVGVVVAKIARLPDLQKIGSGGTGATNVLRTGNKWAAVATLVLDVAKGVVAIWICEWMGVSIYSAAVGVMIGHIYSVWLKFKGGKGVAVYVGVMIASGWVYVGVFAVVWLGIAAVFRYSSLASLAGTLVSAVAFWMMAEIEMSITVSVMTAICWGAHRGNIKRLIAGEESKIKI